jgi:hypothetical protein
MTRSIASQSSIQMKVLQPHKPCDLPLAGFRGMRGLGLLNAGEVRG